MIIDLTTKYIAIIFTSGLLGTVMGLFIMSFFGVPSEDPDSIRLVYALCDLALAPYIFYHVFDKNL